MSNKENHAQHSFGNDITLSVVNNHLQAQLTKMNDIPISSGATTNDSGPSGFVKKAKECEKRFACSLCDYKCNQNAHLVRHIRTHTGKTLYQCGFCDHKSSNSEHLRTHISRFHTELVP